MTTPKQVSVVLLTPASSVGVMLLPLKGNSLLTFAVIKRKARELELLSGSLQLITRL